MKKTFTINISGTVFHIEDDAYEKLQNYILKLKQYFGTNEEGKEIIADIESRIAELFIEKSKDNKEVIIEKWVDEVIEIMGNPEDFMAEEEESEIISERSKRKRRLYRDPDHRIFGGVCGGLGAYFNMDPVILRIIFIVLAILNGIGILAYIILWIAVPKAVTTAQRLEMRGKEVTISNIEKSIREEYKEVKESVKNLASPENKEKRKENASELGDAAYNFLKIFLKIVVVFIGIVLILSGFFGLLGFISSLWIGQSVMSGIPIIWSPEVHVPGILNNFIDPGVLTFGMIAIALLVGIPLLAMIFVGAKLIFRFKSNNALIVLSMLGIWLLALVSLIIVSLSQASNFSTKTSLSSSETIYCDECSTLYLEMSENYQDDYNDLEIDIDISNFRLKIYDGKEVLVGEPSLDIEPSNSSNFILLVRKQSRGRNLDDAKENIQEISYTYELKDSTLVLDSYFSISDVGQWREQEVDIVLKVPEGKSVYLGERLDEIMYGIENVSNTWEGDMIGKYWEMTDEGLALKEQDE